MKKLKKILKEMKSAVLAFSGGTDSAFLLKAALKSMGRDNVLAVIARSESFPESEYKHARALAKRLGCRLMTIKTNEAEDPNFLKNPVNRCYYCKKELFNRLKAIAEKNGFDSVMDGFNYDDRRDMRYGHKAAAQLGVRSPLAEAKLGKKDIRRFSRQFGLPTWDKPPFACLASRVPYRKRITKRVLKRIERSEEVLYRRGFRQVRVRAHDDTARIEVPASDIKRILADRPLQKYIARKLRQAGFSYVTLDLDGYRTGSMNEVLKRNKPLRKHR